MTPALLPLSPSLPMRQMVTTGCHQCRHLAACGGREDQPDDFLGCFDRCFRAGEDGCCDQDCDLTCPNNPQLFYPRDLEVGGLGSTACGPLLPMEVARLPRYIPMIRQGVPRDRPVASPIVALSLFEALCALRRRVRGGARRGAYESVDAREFRRRLRLREDSQILLVGVAPDPELESFWSKFRRLDVPSLLRPLELLGVTTPNFSFALNVPRHEHLFSRRRILICAEELSAAGVPVAVHVNSMQARDWELWAQLLRDNPRQFAICQEFNTGCGVREEAERELDMMLWLGRESNRQLHPILVGGGEFADLAAARFEHFTVVSSNAYMRTVHRRLAAGTRTGGATRWQAARSARGASVSKLLDHNITADAASYLRPARPSPPPTVRAPSVKPGHDITLPLPFDLETGPN